MAELIDEVLENEMEASSIDDGVVEEETQPETPEVEAKDEANPEDDLPEKYKGKSVNPLRYLPKR